MAQAQLYTGDVTAALVAVGANLSTGGNPPESTVQMAIDSLRELGGPTTRQSRLFHTPAFPPGSGPQFVNAAVCLGWNASAESLLSELHRIEEAFGRTRATRWEARVMDLDLIGLGQRVSPDRETQERWVALSPEAAAQDLPDRLILPHPRLAERAFVLAPLADIAPHWVHPITGRSVSEMLDALPPADRAAITPIEPVARLRESGCQ